MKRKKLAIISIILPLILTISIFHYISKPKKNLVLEQEKIEEEIYTSNIINDVKYSSKDIKGNSYIINASIGEIDYSKPNIVYLTNVRALIKLENSNEIKISSEFGRYNIDNFDTIFSKNVIVTYLDNKITSEYLDFSIERNSMIISKKVIFKNLENILKSDVIEIDIDTKDANIFMYNNNKKVNIKKN